MLWKNVGHPPQAFPNPALRKEREGRATHCVADAREVKSLGHPAVPAFPARDSGGIDYFLKADFPLPIRVTRRFRTRRDCRSEPTGISEQKSGIAQFTLDIDR